MLLLPLLLTCCAQAAPKPTPRIVVDDVTVIGRGAFVIEALPRAKETLQQHQLALRVASTVIVHDDVDAFVKATGQTDHELRAWSTYDTVHLLPRETWADPSTTAVQERVAHELCHLALWQRQTEERAQKLPRFVSEGVCSVVAGQGARRLSLAATRALVDTHHVDFSKDAAFSYSYAHHVFAAYASCAGADVLRVVDDVVAGADVAVALGASPRSLLLGACPPSGPRSGDVTSEVDKVGLTP